MVTQNEFVILVKLHATIQLAQDIFENSTLKVAASDVRTSVMTVFIDHALSYLLPYDDWSNAVIEDFVDEITADLSQLDIDVGNEENWKALFAKNNRLARIIDGYNRTI